MAMDMNISSSYASGYMNSQTTGRNTESSKTAETVASAGTSQADSTQKTTQDYLKNLQKKYSNMNISVIDFKNEVQERSYMRGCSGYNNVAISSKMIEKIAKDPEVAEKYEKVIEGLPDIMKEVKETTEATPGRKLISGGVEIDKDGKVTYWTFSSGTSEAEVPGSEQKELLKKNLEEKRTEKKKQVRQEAKTRMEEQQKARTAKKKQEMELLLVKGQNADDLLFNIRSGEAEPVAGIGAGRHVNIMA